MGNYCGCLKDPFLKTEASSTLDIANNQRIMEELQRNVPKIIKIQALIRGFLSRKKYIILMNEYYKTKVNEQLLAYSGTILNFNTRVLHSFYYGNDDEEDELNHLKEFRGCIDLENGAKYFGEW